MIKFIKRTLLFILIVALIAGSFIVYQGHQVYKNALNSISLTDKIEKIKKDDSYVELSSLPSDYKNAVISVEDHRYYKHGPIDIIAIIRATVSNIRSKDFMEGGSTITQQVAKNVVFNQEQSWTRKLGEIFAAFDLEKNYTKNEVFEIYVNTAYFGDGFYGIYDASHGYYNKDPKDLNLDEASMLAGVPNAPSLYSPNVNLNLAKKRQAHVIKKMQEYGYITQEQALPFLSFSY